tara:strand:- start:123 stop:383 length:261 start_codon:yes stop_codon:yes gene_type:complete
VVWRQFSGVSLVQLRVPPSPPDIARQSFPGQNCKKPYFGLFLRRFLRFSGQLNKQFLSQTLVKLVITISQLDGTALVGGVLIYIQV